ncbi:SRPBCC family protein [Bradyrhizobium sp.]|uniref:SRPBCC family protein n=1 Tax=Bradyrhizobium sp. TaxID=376 RepID=UPI003C521646
MKLHQEFVIARPLDEVWSFLHDIPKVAGCLPGADYIGPTQDGRHAGKVSAKVGPFQASFEGEAQVRYDETNKLVSLEGKGIDRKGASRGKMTMDCALRADGERTALVVDSDVQLSGTIAQFGRTGLITEIANALVANFVANAEASFGSNRPQASSAAPEAARSEGITAPTARPIGGLALLLTALRGLFKSWFRGTQSNT